MARPNPPNVDALIAKAAREAEIDPQLYRRLIKRGERSWKGWQSSPMGAFGPAQLMPGTAAGLAAKYKLDPQDYYGNLLAGAHYLREQLSTFGGDKRKAVAAYNAGPGNVEKYGGVPPFEETQKYVKNIFGNWNPDAKGRPGQAPTPTPRGPTATPGQITPGKPGTVPTFNFEKALRALAGGGSAMMALGGASGFNRSAMSALAQANIAGTKVTPYKPEAPVTSAPRLGNFVQPLTTPMPGGSEFDYVDAEGAPDERGVGHHAGKDWFAPGGTRVVAPITGRVVEVKQSRGNSGQVFGGVVKIQAPNGRVFVFRHVDPRNVKVGASVKAGQPVATVSPWTDGSPHAHVEVWKTLKGGYRYGNMLDPAELFAGTAPSSTSKKAPKAQGTLHEAFYDPLGGYDEGNEIGAIGGHSDHVHFSFGSRAQALAIMAEAKRRGMSVGENPWVGDVDPVHTEGSYHYRTFPGKVNGKVVGMGADISGTPKQMADIYRWAKARYT